MRPGVGLETEPSVREAKMNRKKGSPAPLLAEWVQMMSCDLTAAELAKLADELAGRVGDLETKEAAEKDRRKAHGEVVAEIEVRIRMLAKLLRDKEEQREVKMERRAHYARGVAETVRLDTGEITEERPLRPDERQMPLADIAQAAMRDVAAEVNAGALDGDGITVRAEVKP